ncbi:hypothetical protein HG531_009944 [Fusarium graminearum]|nr:hypothetical protein HG531_009944 [Fusarium graminearum]
MLSGVLVFNQKGENLIFRAFRNDCRPRLADVFRIQVISNAQVRSPILTLGSTTFSHVKHENIYLVAITKSNANAALVFEFLYRLIQLGKGYFGKFDEEAVKNNFVLVYELLDEIIDFGYPQNTETDTLKMYITTEGVKSESRKEDTSKITMQATGALSWRKADVKYRKNEAFVDVIEDVNLLMSATGAVLRADVTGQIIMRAYLSGTPECKFGLNDRLLLDNDGLLSLPSGNKMGTKATKAAAGSVTLEDCQFHQCVKLGKFDADRIISFVPPDGEFELMRYRATENVNLPFKVHAIVNEVGRSKVEYSIGVKANFGSKLFATNVIVKIPTPLNTAKITERCTQGKAKYEPSENVIIWKIGRFTGQSEYVLSAEAILTSMTEQRAWSRPPLSMNFSLLMFTSSGLLVRYLKVFEKSNYSSVKWVRYMTRAGSYEISGVNQTSKEIRWVFLIPSQGGEVRRFNVASRNGVDDIAWSIVVISVFPHSSTRYSTSRSFWIVHAKKAISSRPNSPYKPVAHVSLTSMAIFFAPRKAEASSVDHWFSRMSLMGGGQRSVSDIRRRDGNLLTSTSKMDLVHILLGLCFSDGSLRKTADQPRRRSRMIHAWIEHAFWANSVHTIKKHLVFVLFELLLSFFAIP